MKLVGTKDGVKLPVRVQPRASRSEVAGIHDGALRVRVTAPPADGEANRELRRILSKALGIPASQVEIAHGHRARSKMILIRGLRPGQVKEALDLR